MKDDIAVSEDSSRCRAHHMFSRGAGVRRVGGTRSEAWEAAGASRRRLAADGESVPRRVRREVRGRGDLFHGGLHEECARSQWLVRDAVASHRLACRTLGRAAKR